MKGCDYALSKKSKNKLPLIIKILIIFISILILLLGIAFGIFYTSINKMNTVKINKEDLAIVDDKELEQFTKPEKIENIALFGIDSPDGIGRSDAIMIATLDPIHNKLKITSIMRDSYVNIPDRGYDKINHAYAFGGPELSIKTINQNFGLNIEDFVAVDFNSLPKVIDTLGGMTLDITSEELRYINGYIDGLNSRNKTNSPHITSTGSQKVNGTQALAYSRIRYTSGGDYKRTERQRTVLNNLFNIALSTSISSYPSLVNEVLPLINTSLTANDILSLATKTIGMDNVKLEQERFPRDNYCNGDMINGIYYLVFDEAKTKEQMMHYIFDDK